MPRGRGEKSAESSLQSGLDMNNQARHAQYIQGICPLPFISLYTWSNLLNTLRKLNEDDYWRCLDRILKHKSPRRLPQSNLGQKLENWREFWASAECRWNALHL